MEFLIADERMNDKKTTKIEKCDRYANLTDRTTNDELGFQVDMLL